ncbi:Ribonuclease 3 [Mycena kentingensis (nom. inval.)]|nr:Ribonuclease 3 [Mycena kentingensis (nom. inval.)]
MAAAQFPSPSIGDLPPLPQIQGDDLRKRVFTHRSFHGRPAQTFEDPLGDISPDNEKLEHLGDSVLNLAVTTLLEEMYPGLKVGPASKVRARIVENAHLAQLSVKYALPEGLHVHTTQAMALRNTPSIAADLFEAYIGGVYTEQGFAVVQAWLQALLRPHAAAAYDHIRAQHGLSPAGSAPSTPQGLGPTDGGHLAFFNQQLQVAHRHVEWRDLDIVDWVPSGMRDWAEKRATRARY